MNTKKIISLIINIGIVISVICGVYLISLRDGITLFKWYTVLSNIFTAVISLCFVIFTLKKSDMPEWVSKFRYISTCTVTLTIIVVATILAPSRGPGGHKEMMLQSFGLHLHTLCPLLSLIGLLAVEKPKITIKDSLYAILPTLGYALVLIILNCINVVEGPYFFLLVKKNGALKTAFWVVALSSAAYVINLIIFGVLKLINKNK